MDLEQSALFKELSQGKQLAEMLRNSLSSSSSNHTRQMLTEQILSSCQKALSLINWVPPGSPVSEDSNDQPHTFKKRKTSRKWGDQVKVCSESSLEGPVGDGLSWRKYGQKDILGSKYPRGYYRCTHRPTQGCLATKQVQRSDNDPTIFEVTYRGRHTCKQSYETRAPPETTRARDESFKEKNKNDDDDDLQVIRPCDDEKQKQPEEVLLSFGSDSNVKSEDSVSWEDISFTFPNPKTEPEGMRNDEDIFFKDSTVEINQNTLYESLNSSFMSTGTSDQCNYFSVSTPSSVSNSVPFCGLDFHLAEVEFNSDFPFDDPDIFC